MSGHLKLLGLFLNLILGIVLFVYIFHLKKRYFQSVFNALMIYISSLIIGLGGLFFSKYWDMNISKEMEATISPLAENLSSLIMYLVLFFMSYSVISITLQFLVKPFPRRLKTFYIFSAILVTLALFSNFLLTPSSRLYKISDLILENYGALFILIEIAYLVRLFVFAKPLPSVLMKNAVRYFSLIFLIRYLLILLAIMLIPSVLRGFVFLLFLHGGCFLWIKYAYLPYLQEQSSQKKNSRALDQLSADYDISPREKEILNLILLGKTNREIENQLFISYNTVKNHVYSIFKKIGVKNRFQLFKYLESLK